MSKSIDRESFNQKRTEIQLETIRLLQQEWTDELNNPNGFDYEKLNEINARINKMKDRLTSR